MRYNFAAKSFYRMKLCGRTFRPSLSKSSKIRQL